MWFGGLRRGRRWERRRHVDFYVHQFVEPEAADSYDRATQLVKAFRKILRPYNVDIRGIPGWPIDPDFEAGMKRDAIDLHEFLALSSPESNSEPKA
jgi:hypothetical protein